MDFTKGQIAMITNMVNCELVNRNTVYDKTELKNLKQVLNIAFVMQRSELLKAFRDHFNKNNHYDNHIFEADVDDFLKAFNCA